MINKKVLIRDSFAKINLYLDTLKREKKYTKIRTLFSEIDLCDTISYQANRSDRICLVTQTDELANNKNLIYTVARFIQKQFSVECGATIRLTKRIPIAAGLGGGSSNAATTINALSELWKLDISLDKKQKIADMFGSDITFFLYGGFALGEGRGERVSPFHFKQIDNILLVNPKIQIKSSVAYQLVENYRATKNWEKLLKKQNIKYCYNALSVGITKKYKEIDNIIKQMKELGAINSILSGSGSTVIGFFPNLATIEKAKNQFQNKNYWIFKTKTKRRNYEFHKS